MIHRFSRRQSASLIVNSSWLIIIVGLILSACAGATPSAEPVPAESEPQELDFHNWDTYIDPAILSDFEKKFNAKINYTNYSSNEQLYEDFSTVHEKRFLKAESERKAENQDDVSKHT